MWRLMWRHEVNRLVPMLAAVIVAFLFAGHANASGILVARFGGEHGHAATDNPTAIYYNPAALSLGKGTRVFIDGSLALRSFTYTRDPGAIDNVLHPDPANAEDPGGNGTGTPPSGIDANSGEASLFNVLGAPFLGVATDFGVEGLGVGLGFYAPFGGSSVWDNKDETRDFAGSEDGPQRWWIIEGTIRSLYFTGAASYMIEPLNLSFGAGINLVRNEVNTVRARNSDGTDNLISGECGTEIGIQNDKCSIQEGRAHVDVSNYELSVGLGLLWQPMENLWVGASWQSSPGFGENRLEGEADLIVGGGPYGDDRALTQAELRQQMPDVFRLAVRYQPTENIEVRVKSDYVRWSLFERQCVLDRDNDNRSCNLDAPVGKIAIIPRYWEDTLSFGAGASYFLGADHDIELIVGATYDPAAIPDKTLETSLYDADKVVASLGARFELLEDSLAVAATWSQIFYSTREVDPRGKDTGAIESDLARVGLHEGERNPDSAGKYEHSVGMLNVNVEYRF